MAARSGMFSAVLFQVLFLCLGFSLAFGGMELPSKLKDVPLYSGSKIEQVMDMNNNAMAMMSVKADRDALLDFYRQNMKDKGWKVAFQAEQEESAVINFSKDNQTIQLSVQNGDDGMLRYHLLSADQ